MRIKRRLLIIAPYGATWLVLAGLSGLASRIWGLHIPLWVITLAVIGGAWGDWFTEWIKSKK